MGVASEEGYGMRWDEMRWDGLGWVGMGGTVLIVFVCSDAAVHIVLLVPY